MEISNAFGSFEIFLYAADGSLLILSKLLTVFWQITANLILALLVLSSGTAFGYVIQYLYNAIKDIASNHKLAHHVCAILLSLFLFIALWNLYGLTDNSFAVTGHIIVTATLAVLIFFYGFVLSLRVNYLEVFTIVKAHGVPKIITPLVMAIETLSVSIRPLSLAVRLFSNILAGHILLHMVSDFYKNSLKNFNLIVGLLGLSGFFAVFTLEAGVSIIQPYVFFLLGCIYIFDLLLRSNLKFSRSNRFLKTLSI